MRCSPGLEDWARGGDEDKMPVLDVGIGVGYFENALGARACLLAALGRPGDDESGSKGGSNEGAGRFTPATRDGEEVDAGGSIGSSAVDASMFLTGEDDMVERGLGMQRHNRRGIVQIGIVQVGIVQVRIVESVVK